MIKAIKKAEKVVAELTRLALEVGTLLTVIKMIAETLL